MSNPSPIVQAIVRGARARGVDPQAALAVAGQEGLSGRIGDAGHAFGPFQENDAGGVLTGRFPGQSPQQLQQWAMSPGGIADALDRIAGVAKGLSGPAAVRAIVSRFERPADPQGEISRALAGYGGQSVGGGQYSAPPGVPSGGPDARHAFATALLSAISPTGQLDNSALSGALQTRQQALAAGGGTALPAAAAGPTGGGPSGGIAELLREGTGGPTHSTGPHIHAAFTNPQLELAAIGWAQQHGLHVGENPYVGDTVDPVHAKNSYHYRDFPGSYNGRKLGQAIDVSGPQQDAFFQWLQQRRG